MRALAQEDTARKFEAALIGVNMLVVATGLGLCIYCAVEEKFRYLGSDMYRQSCVCVGVCASSNADHVSTSSMYTYL